MNFIESCEYEMLKSVIMIIVLLKLVNGITGSTLTTTSHPLAESEDLLSRQQLILQQTSDKTMLRERRQASTLTTTSHPLAESEDLLSRQQLILQQARDKIILRERRQASTSCNPNVVVPLVAYIGQKVELQCRRCQSTGKSTSDEEMKDLRWRAQARTAASEEVLDTKKLLLGGFSIEYEDMRLVIRSIDEEHSGKYYCTKNEAYLSNYDVTVLAKPDFHLVIPSEGLLPYEDDRDGKKLVMYTKWGTWTSCNHCDTPGERVRIGYCYAMVLLEDFPDGLPCRSRVVPYTKRNMYINRKDEKMVEACTVSCPTGSPDQSEEAGRRTFYIPFGKNKPTLPPFLARRAIYADMGSDVALACPTVDFEKAVRWQNGSTPLRLLELHQTYDKSQHEPNRVQIDAHDVLHIRNLTMWDTASYSCWQEDSNIVTIKVKVVKPLLVDEKIKGQLLYSGFVFTGVIMFLICFGIFKNRKFVK